MRRYILERIWNKKESNMSKEEWDKHREWVFSFMGEIIEKRVLH